LKKRTIRASPFSVRRHGRGEIAPTPASVFLGRDFGIGRDLGWAIVAACPFFEACKSVPATGELKNDLKLIAGLSYNF
jgi:hypothetical protein